MLMTSDVEFTLEHHESVLRSGGAEDRVRGFGCVGGGRVWWCGVVVLLVGSLLVTPPPGRC